MRNIIDYALLHDSESRLQNPDEDRNKNTTMETILTQETISTT